MGIGTDNLHLIDTDSDGKMDVIHLRQQIEKALGEGARPFAVLATAGWISIRHRSPLHLFDS